MIAASEPLEFIPHGRRTLLRHPGSVHISAPSDGHTTFDTSILNKLKNVAISEKNDYVLKTSECDYQREWWMVRQICLTDSSKYSNDDNINSPNILTAQSESINPITPNFNLKSDFNTSIKCEMNINKNNKTNVINSDVTNDNNYKDCKLNELYRADSKIYCCYEEELYVKGKTAVWSRGLISNPDSKINEPESRVTVTSYTCETPIKHALFCNFHASVNDRHMFDALKTLSSELKSEIRIQDNFEETCHNPVPSICIIDTNTLRAFTESGEDYITSLQFQVKSIWSTKYGILLEKEAAPLYHQTSFFRNVTRMDMKGFDQPLSSAINKTNQGSLTKYNSSVLTPDNCRLSSTISESDVPLPTCFSLSHPLDEMAPVLTKMSPFSTQYYNDGHMQIVFVSECPSISLTFNCKTGLHSLWRIRKATSDECHSLCGNWNKTTNILNQSTHLNIGDNSSPFHYPNQRIMSNTQKNTTSSWLGGGNINSPYTTRSGTINASTTQINKHDSPMAGMFSKLGLTPHTSLGQASNSSMHTINLNPPPPTQPLYPDICFEHIWTENQGISRSNATNWSAATKTFLHCDHIGQNYLCYLIPNSVQQLFIARLETPHGMSGDLKKIIVGVVTSISAKDAINVPSNNLYAVIDLSGNIILYSGLFMIGKVHIGGVLAGLINSPYNQTKKFDSSFPRRSSLLPMLAKDAALLDDSALHQLSPVPHKISVEKNIDYSGLIGLRDPVGNRITLEYEKGKYYRISLPDLTSNSLILKCITAFKQILPKDIVMQVISKWYGMRNSPGTHNLCSKSEWSMFISMLLNLLGYDVSKLSPSKQPEYDNIEIMSKKKRTSEDGNQEDWEYLLNSSHHTTFGDSLTLMLNLQSENNMPSKNFCNKFELKSDIDVHASCINHVNKNSTDMDTTHQEYSIQDTQSIQFNCNSLLFPYILSILFSLHLLYEELKMNVLVIEDMQPLAQFLYQLCVDLRLDTYINHYWKDFPNDCPISVENNLRQISESDMKKVTQPIYFDIKPPSIFNQLFLLMKGNPNNMSYPFLNGVNIICRDMIEIVGLLVNGSPGLVHTITSKEGINACSTPRQKVDTTLNVSNIDQKTVLILHNKDYTLKDIYNLPPSINLFLINVLLRCKMNPPEDWPHEAYSLIMREDLALQAKLVNKQPTTFEEKNMKENVFSQYKEYDPENLPGSTKSSDSEKNTGLENIDTKIMRLRFPKDLRVSEMCNLLQSSIPVTIALTQRPEVSDHDFIEEQERYLYALCTRTMALPVGRGMVTLRSAPCVITEPLHIPKLCASGRAPPRNATIELSNIEVPPHYSAWPLFHNGVAAGLKLVPMGSTKIDSAWVVYNKPKQGTVDMLYEHAGFLMALGLNGHLKDMAFMDMYEYLVKCHEMTSVGLLLGIAATYRGTMDLSTTKLMGIHVEALLPPTSIELDIPQNIQVAALLGVGLLYQRTAHTHITQVLLSEIGRPPGPEMENSSEREGYSLAAGLGLGLVCLGAYKTAPHHLTSTLRHYMLGGNKRPLTGSQKEKYKLPSFQIREGPTVNVDVTAPGATLALGMLYLKSGNTEVAKWLAPPQTHYLLDFVRPDLLLLRVIARGLILWDYIEPTQEWVQNYVPESVKPYCFVKPTAENIDYEAMNQVYCNIVAGACFSIGLRFAGSTNQEACDTILYYAKEFTKLGLKSIGELAGKSTIETCLNLILISAAMVMAGTGDIQIMRLCRQQRARAGPVASSLTYGSQLAVHSALGLLFLGAGRYTLSTSPESIAALICAFFPKFPTHSNDNRYHLQAFRHLYVLATEPRLIIPRDISSGMLCYANIRLIKFDGQIITMKAPCLLPELHTLKEVHIDDNRYWPIVFKRDMNWDQLLFMLQNLSCVDIKQRAGYLSYIEDPHGFRSLLAQTLTSEKINVWSAELENILAFSNDPTVINFTKHYLMNSLNKLNTYNGTEPKLDKKNEHIIPKICKNCYFINLKRLFCNNLETGNERKRTCVCEKNNTNEREFIQQLAMITYECVIKDTLAILPMWITFLKILKKMEQKPKVYHVWQLKLFFVQMENYDNSLNKDKDNHQNYHPFISNDFASSMKHKINSIMDIWEPELLDSVKNFINNCCDKINSVDASKLASYITFYDIPKGLFSHNISRQEISLIDLFTEVDNLNIDASNVYNIVRIFNTPLIN